MKILFLTGSLNQGGAEYQILELAKMFKEKGHLIEVFAITDYSFYKPFIKENDLIYSHLFNHQSKLKRVLLTAKKIRKMKPEIIISYLKVPSQVALYSKILSGLKIKLIVGERTSDRRLLLDKYYFNLMRLADIMTVNSISKLNYLKQNFPGLKRKLKFFPNIIDIDKFRLINKKYDSSLIKIGFVGRVSPEKNVLNLIKAINILLDQGKSVELYIYGDTKNRAYADEVVNLINDNILQKKVIMKGRSNNMNEVYKNIDVLCLISDYEGFSNVISEALSCGLPIITSDIEENKYLVDNGINGFVVNHKAPTDIAKGINSYLILTKVAKLKMAVTNRKKAEDMFNKEVVYEQYMALLNSL